MPPKADANKSPLVNRREVFVRIGVRVGKVASKALKNKARKAKSRNETSGKRKAAKRSANFTSESWYANAALSIGIGAKAETRTH
jgi:hypothetical protein